MNSKMPSNDSWDPTVLYSDLDMSEGLAEALKRSASGIGLTLDGLVDGFGRAELVTGRGIVSIHVGAWERGFGIGIHESGIEWASGATDDLGQVLRSIAAWQDGEPLDDHVLEFPFMKPGKLARAFAEGRVAEAQWQDLLDSEYRTGGQQLLVRLAQFGELRSFFPEISYGELRFTEAPPRQGDRMFRVQSDGAVFRVRESGPERREYALGGLDEVARRIVEFFAAD
ncbi:hypothetical protein [Streptomyces rhizosphaerihabitans]|uniref:hypothetical protein n=1 Tax=Streptomyces rhizosphaerihabitans TaxID=1266770 RepID=UPI0021BEBF49|nr:hypothetical protein [Streptomyces rhizosphaerihabitans]MCT9006132.1 hypothetical protein [Streptomyces rhizosphaerihabitans]